MVRPRDRADRDDLPGTLLLHDRRDGVAAIHGPEQIHLRDKLQEGRIKWCPWACLDRRAHSRPALDPAPLLDDTRRHRLDRLMVTDINLDAYGSTSDASISATVVSAVISLASASNSS